MWKWNFKGFSAQRGSESPDVVDSQRRAAAIPRVAVVPGTGTLFAGPGRGSEHGKWMEMEDKKHNFKRTLSLSLSTHSLDGVRRVSLEFACWASPL